MGDPAQTRAFLQELAVARKPGWQRGEEAQHAQSGPGGVALPGLQKSPSSPGCLRAGKAMTWLNATWYQRGAEPACGRNVEEPAF